MDNCRELLFQDIQKILVSNNCSSSEIENALLICLDRYEVIERTTEVVISNQSTNYILQSYAATLVVEGKAKGTINNYIRGVKAFLNSCNKEVTDIEPLDARIYLAKRQKTIHKSTANTNRVILNSFFEWCVREGIIQNNPLSNIKPIKPEVKNRFAFTDTEIDSLRSNCNTLRERAELELLLSSGLRCSELCNLNIEDLDFQGLKVIVKNGKGGKDRTTYMSEVAAYHIKQYLNTRQDTCNVLFMSRPNNRIKQRTLAEDLFKIGKRANIDNVHPHKCRRTFCTKLYKRGMDLRSIQLLMGHANIDTTTRYISSDVDIIGSEYAKYA